jgi:mannose-P-dolichol utilization defect protein 1
MDSLAATLRPHLQPLTRALPQPIRDAVVSLLGEACYKTLILDINPTPECVKLAVSKGLGIGIIGASSVVKIPQLLKLLSSGSSDGISFLSYLLETAAYLISLAYNARQGFPFSTYGETALVAVQNVVIAALVLHFHGKSAGAALFVAGLATAGYALFTPDVVSGPVLGQLMAGAGVLGVASKVPQIWTVWQQGGTGQLSAFAVGYDQGLITGRWHTDRLQVFNYLLGSLSRIFTTLQEVDDKLILYGFVAGFLLNAVLASQMVYHWKSPATAKHAKGTGKLPEKVDVKATSTGSSTSAHSKVKSPTTRRRG